MNTRWARVARGTLAAVAAVLVSALFHVAAGAHEPSALAITVSLVFAIPACVLLTGARLSLWRQIVSVVLSQFVFHALFSLTPGPDASGASMPGGMTHLHSGATLVATDAAQAIASHPSTGHAAAQMSMMMPADPLMWLAHASAALVTVLALRFGEQAFWGLLATARIRIVSLLHRVVLVLSPTDAPSCPPIDARPLTLPAPRLVIGRMRHRGPPVRSCVGLLGRA